MNKKLFLIIAGVLLLILIFAWGYLIFFGKPDNAGELFANLGFGGASTPIAEVETPPLEEQEPVVDVSSSAVQQLTTRPVVGYGVTTGFVRYMEEGTGHIYEIDLSTGQEQRLTNTTIPRVTTAIFNETADQLIFTIYGDQITENTLGILPLNGDTALETVSLPQNSANVHFLDENTLTYTLTGENTTFYTLDITDRTAAAVTTVPFWSIKTVVQAGEVFFMNRFSPNLQGALFDANPLSAITETLFGFTGFLVEDYIIYNNGIDGKFMSYSVDRTTGNTQPLSLLPLEEKCAQYNENTLYCGAGTPGQTTPEILKSWYQGTIRMNDYLWSLDLSTGTGLLLIVLDETTGREIDVFKPKFDLDKNNLFFINKNNNTLWRYEL